MVTEMNGWLLFEWGQAMRAAITTSPWEMELMVVLLLPAADDRQDVYHSTLLPADPKIPVQRIQQLFGLTERRAEYLHQAFLEALDTFYSEELPQPTHKVIPIVPIS